jgi:hypothetical protein
MRSLTGIFPTLAPKKKSPPPPMGTPASSYASAGQEAADVAPLDGWGTNTGQANNMLEKNLQLLTSLAHSERLECAVNLLQSLQQSLSEDQVNSGTPPGTLTVRGWFHLLSRWERQLEQSRLPQIKYAKPFIEEAMMNRAFVTSPIMPLFQELLEMMMKALEPVQE